jgi:beta-galactosidase
VIVFFSAIHAHTTAGIKPHTEALLHIPKLDQKYPADAHLNLIFVLTKPTPWADATHVVATGQLELTKPTPLHLLPELTSLSSTHPKLALTNNNTILSIMTPHKTTWKFDLAHGALTSWKRPAPSSSHPHRSPNIHTTPHNFDHNRAQTDNDRGCDFGRNWRDRRLNLAKPHLIQSSWQLRADGVVEVKVHSRIAPPVLNWALEIHATYHFRSNGSVLIRARAKPTGELLPRAWGRLGLVVGIRGFERARWFGRGPGECYRDRKESQAVGRWEVEGEGLGVEYEFPQENGNRGDVRWVEFLGGLEGEGVGGGEVVVEERMDMVVEGRGGGEGMEGVEVVQGGNLVGEKGKKHDRLLRARFGDFEGASFSALPYTARDLDEAKHPYELRERRREDTVVHLDWMHHGLGTGSCGPETLPKYTLDAGKEYDVEVLLD